MNVEAYNLIIDKLEPLLNKCDFKPVDSDNESYFLNDALAVKVVFDENRNVFELLQCPVVSEQPDGNWKALTSYLFLPDYTEKDAKSVANEFEDSLSTVLGLRSSAYSKVNSQIPTVNKASDVRNVDTLSARFLQIFPQYKETYSQYVSESGQFLYVTFFTDVAAPLMVELLKSNDKKRLVKYFDILNDHYCNGDKNVRSVISTVVFAEPLKDKPELVKTALEYCAEYIYLKRCIEFSISVQKK